MSIRRQRINACTTRLASVLLILSGFGHHHPFVLQALGDSGKDSPPRSITPSSPAPAPTLAPTQTVTNRVPSRPRPAFWQGDPSLTEEQKAALRTLTQSYRQENKVPLESLQRLRRELEELVFAPKPDSAAIQAKANETAAIEGQLAISRARLIQELRPRLSPEQLERLKSLRGAFELSERFSVATSSTNRSTLQRRPPKRSPEPDASGSAKPRE